jgi:hypothetical protein
VFTASKNPTAGTTKKQLATRDSFLWSLRPHAALWAERARLGFFLTVATTEAKLTARSTLTSPADKRDPTAVLHLGDAQDVACVPAARREWELMNPPHIGAFAVSLFKNLIKVLTIR